MTFSDDLQWEKHTQATAAKASRTLGFLRRNLKDCSKQVRSTTYKSMVRPTIKYASSSWDPYKTEDADYLDKVQRRAARYACNNYTERTQGCVTAMVNSLGWETLQDRRKIQRLTMTTWSRSQRQNPSSGQTTAEREGHRGFLFHTPA